MGEEDPTSRRRGEALESLQGREYWRSLEELLDTEDFREHLHREFRVPIDSGVDRRQLLTLMGASIALAGLTGCTRQPTERIYPYVKAPEELVPGRAALLRDGAGAPGLREGRAGQELRGPAHQGRRQRAPPREPRRQRRVRAGLHPQHVRPRPLADADRARPDQAVERPARRGQAGPRAGAVPPRLGPALPDDDRHLSDAAGADRRRAGRSAGSEVDRLGAGRPRERLRGHEAGFRGGAAAGLRLRQGRRRALARGGLPGLGPFDAAVRARLRLAAARRFHEPVVRRGVDADAHGRARRPPAAAVAGGPRGLRDVRRGRGRGRIRARGRRRSVRRGGRGRPEGAPRREPGRGRRRAAPVGPRPRPRDERRAREHGQDRPLRRVRGRSGRRADGGVLRADPRDGGRQGRDARHRGRQPGLQRSRGPRVHEGPAEGRAADPPVPLQRRDLAALPLERGGGARPRELERRPLRGRHGDDPAAAHRAPLLGPDGARAARGVLGRAGEELARHRPRLLEGKAAWHGLRASPGRRLCTTASSKARRFRSSR